MFCFLVLFRNMYIENCLFFLFFKIWLFLILNFGCRVIDKENFCFWRLGFRLLGRIVVYFSIGWENFKR